MPNVWQLKEMCPDLASLTQWAVEARYPGNWTEATSTEADMAVEQARVI